RKYCVAASAPRTAVCPSSSTVTISSARAWAATTTAAPAATTVHTRRGVARPRWTSRTKSTPPIATAWPARARPRRITSRNAAIGPEEHQGEGEEQRRADGGGDQEPVGEAEGGEHDDDVDEVAVGHGADQAGRP